MRARVPREGLSAAWSTGQVRDLARDMLEIAADGLRARAIADATGADERRHLEPLQRIVAGAPTQAEHWLERYRTAWSGDASRIWAEAEI